jgi:AraC family transcriptional regulator
MEQWEKLLAVQRMQDYIETHITEPITLSDLARRAGYSPWHAARVFKDLTGKAPFDYIRSLRLSQAAEKLRNGGIKVVDVAFDFLFGSHEGFTRAFSKQFGTTPKSCARGKGVKLFMPPKVSDYYLTKQKGDAEMTENINTVFVQVVERPKRKLILKRGVKAAHYYEYCEEAGCGVWEVLSGIKDALYEPIGMWLPDGMIKPGTSKYAQGVEVAAGYKGPIPEGYEMIGLPPCKMMVFQGQPFDDEKFEDAIGDLWEVMKKYDPKVYGFEWADEDAPRFQLAPLGYRGYIEARPVRALNK